MTDDELLQAIRESAKRQNEAQVRPLDAETRARIAQRLVVASAPRRRRRLQARAATVVAGLALAAGVAEIVRPGGAAPLPSYELVVSGGAQERRGEPAEPGRPLRLRSADRFELVLRPPTEVRGAVGARAFLVEGGDVRPFTGAIAISPRGAVRVAGTLGDFAGAVPGSGELVIAVGRPEALAQHPGPVMASSSDYQVHRTPVTVE